MLKISLFLLKLIILDEINCLNSDKFCFKNEKKLCTDSIKKADKCEEIKCKSPFSYDCKIFCTTSRMNCENFTNLKLKQRTIRFRKMNSYKIFAQSIQNCTILIQNPSASDFCLNGKNCMLQTRYNGVNNTSGIDCKCPNGNSYICGKYCTKNNLICNAISKSRHITKSCGNGKSIYLINKPKYFAYALVF